METSYIKGYEGLYIIDTNGNIYSNISNKYLKVGRHRNGYEFVCLSKSGIKNLYRIHRLVAYTFIPNPLKKEQVNHINGIKTDNRLENLEWATPSENMLHSYYILKNTNTPTFFKGKFGDEHNKSKSFYIRFKNGDIRRFESGLDFKRKTGLDNTSITYGRKMINKLDKKEHIFTVGKMKGLVLLGKNFERNI